MAKAITSADALTELQRNLTQLSSTMHEIYDLMNTEMSNIGQEWQDGKYQEFVDSFKPQITKCEVLADKYNQWCKKVLTPQIENVRVVEHTDVGGGTTGMSSSKIPGGVIESAAIGSAALGSAAMRGSKLGNFNFGANSKSSPIPAANQTIAQAKWEKDHQMSLDTNNYYIDQNGNAVKKTADFPNATTDTGENANVTESTAPAEASGKRIVPRPKPGSYDNNIGSQPAPATDQTKAQAKWEKDHQMSLDTNNYYIDQNGNAVKKTADFPNATTDTGENANATESTAPAEASGKRIVPRPKPGSYDNNIGSQPAPATDQTKAQAKWGKKHQMSLDTNNYYIDQNGNAVKKTADFPKATNDISENLKATEPTAPAEASGKRIVPRPKPGSYDNNIGSQPAPATDQTKAQAKWEKDHQMSLDTNNYYIDQNGNAVKKTADFPKATNDISENLKATEPTVPAEASGKRVVPRPKPGSSESTFDVSSQQTNTASNVSSINTSINETNTVNHSENNTNINNVNENNTSINNTVINNTTVNNTTVNNTTINNTTVNNTTVNSTTIDNTQEQNISQSPDIKQEIPQNQNIGIPSPTEDNKTINKSDIKDIPYTPFPDAPKRKVVPRPTPNPITPPTNDDITQVRRPGRRSLLGGKISVFNTETREIHEQKGTLKHRPKIKEESLMPKKPGTKRKDRFGK